MVVLAKTLEPTAHVPEGHRPSAGVDPYGDTWLTVMAFAEEQLVLYRGWLETSDMEPYLYDEARGAIQTLKQLKELATPRPVIDSGPSESEL